MCNITCKQVPLKQFPPKGQETSIKKPIKKVSTYNLRSLSWSTISRPADHMQSCSVLFLFYFCLVSLFLLCLPTLTKVDLGQIH